MTGVWRGTLIPDCMDALPRTTGGAPVPYTAAWSSEAGGLRVEPDPLLIRHLGERAPALWQAHGKLGEGTAKLAKFDQARQRWCVVVRACQVCTSPMDPEGAWLVDMRSSQTTDPATTGGEGGQTMLMPDGRRVPLIRDPWICEDCLEFSLRACHGLRDRRKAQNLGLYWVRDYSLVACFEAPDDPAAVLFGKVPKGGAIGCVKIALKDAQPVSTYAFLRHRRQLARAQTVSAA